MSWIEKLYRTYNNNREHIANLNRFDNTKGTHRDKAKRAHPCWVVVGPVGGTFYRPVAFLPFDTLKLSHRYLSPEDRPATTIAHDPQFVRVVTPRRFAPSDPDSVVATTRATGVCVRLFCFRLSVNRMLSQPNSWIAQ